MQSLPSPNCDRGSPGFGRGDTRRERSDQERMRSHPERELSRRLSRIVERGFDVSNRLVNPLFRIRLAQSRASRDHLRDVSAICWFEISSRAERGGEQAGQLTACLAGVARGRSVRCFRSSITDRQKPSIGPGGLRGCCPGSLAETARRAADDSTRCRRHENRSDDGRQGPCSEPVSRIAEIDFIRMGRLPAVSQATRDVAANGKRGDHRDHHEIKAGPDFEGAGGNSRSAPWRDN